MIDADNPGGRDAGSSGYRLVAITDLLVVALIALATVLLATTAGRFGEPTVFRVPLGFAFAFLLPGYAVAAALFPRSRIRVRDVTIAVGGLERLVLALGLSIFLTPLSNLLLTLLGVDVTLVTALGTVATLTILAATVAAVRRLRLATDEGDVVWRPRIAAVGKDAIDFTLDNRANALLAGLVVLSVVGVGAAIATPENGERYTELSLAPPGGDATDGVAAYPSTLAEGDTTTVTVDVENREGETTDYTVIVLLQDVEFEGDDPTFTSIRELDRRTLALEPGESTTLDHQYRADVVDDDLRVTVLLYEDSAPADPTAANAYRAVHVSFAVNGTATGT